MNSGHWPEAQHDMEYNGHARVVFNSFQVILTQE
jgi:hypothetical protein